MKGSIAIGSRRMTPTCPVAAAVVSEAIVAPRKDAVLPAAAFADERRHARPARAEEDRRERNALRIFPFGRNRRALPGRRGKARVRMGAFVLGSRGPVIALPIDAVRRRRAHVFPPDAAVIGFENVRKERVLLDRFHRVRDWSDNWSPARRRKSPLPDWTPRAGRLRPMRSQAISSPTVQSL